MLYRVLSSDWQKIRKDDLLKNPHAKPGFEGYFRAEVFRPLDNNLYKYVGMTTYFDADIVLEQKPTSIVGCVIQY